MKTDSVVWKTDLLKCGSTMYIDSLCLLGGKLSVLTFGDSAYSFPLRMYFIFIFICILLCIYYILCITTKYGH